MHVFEFFTWTNIEVFQQAGKERRDTFSQTFLYAGDLIPRKGVMHLVNAFASVISEFPHAKLLIIGKEENQQYAADVKNRTQELGLGERIHFLPRLPQQELADYMGQAAVFVFPTYSEGLPRVVFEAMSTGLPILSTAVSGIPEIVQEGETGILLQPGDEAELSEKMRWFLEHPQETQEMGRKAYAFACASFSSEAYVQGYRQMFEAAWAILNKSRRHISAEQSQEE
jgi:glycosyltransferase involved in cell wall biosynthesis